MMLSVMNSNIIFAQESDDFLNELVGDNRLDTSNLASKYSVYDFSEIWTTTVDQCVVGIIGEEHMRIKVKILEIEKRPNDTNLYLVSGKSSVMGNVCDFTGAIFIKKVHLFSVSGKNDVPRENKPSKIRGVLVADYEFLENTQQNHVGIFSGKLYSKWHLDSSNRVVYDDTDLTRKGYINNAYIGFWRSYEGNDKRICSWGDYRVPMSKDDFDIESELFRPADKFRSKGWDIYIKAWHEDDAKAKSDELNPWWQ